MRRQREPSHLRAPWRGVVVAAAVLLSACGGSGSADPAGPAPSAPSARSARSSGPPTSPAATAPADPIGSPAATASRPDFVWSASRIDEELRTRMASSWRPGCPVPLADLRHVRTSYLDFDGRPALGELVVHRDAVPALREVFRALYDARFPIRRMRLVDDFGADDDASMAADNTSAFNCRRSTRSGAWSAHAYGRAIDLNPRENPYVRGTTVLPAAGRRHLDRTRPARGLITADGVVVAAFEAAGWVWGGTYRMLKDYQHFSADGR